MNRRDALLTTGSMFVSASLGSLACGGATAGAQNAKAAPPGGAGSPAGLADVAAECLTKGAACVGHCLGMLGAGDTSMAGCARTSYDMTVAMEALAKLAASGSPHLPAFAKLSADFCRDCVVECQKHADKHAVCKECLDACTRTISACQSVPG